MVFALDQADGLTILCALAAALSFLIIALAIGGGRAYRRYKRRLNAVSDRARGVPAPAAAQSLARMQSATPKIDRVARRWLPRRDLPVTRLARTGRSITHRPIWARGRRDGGAGDFRPRLRRTARSGP